MQDLDPIISKILHDRNIEDIDEFLAVKPQLIHDPSLFLNMEKAVDFILDAIDSNKKICIYGDYDVDGISAISILMKLLNILKADVSYYIPSRFDEGYGLNRESLKQLRDEGTDLVITVDCGIVSDKEVEYAKEIGLDIIITDHHDTGSVLPDTIVIDPKSPFEDYPFRELSGTGVAFKLAQSIQRTLGLERNVTTRFLELVALATIADIVPLVDENRTLVKYGMKQLNNGNDSSNAGLQTLIEKTGLQTGKINSYHVGFVLAPHINAAGRMGRADIAVELLTTEDPAKMNEAADYLIEQNNKRKAVQEEAYELCESIVEEKLINDPILLIEAGNIHEGVIGIVAGKIKTKYNKPSVVMVNEGNMLKGSGRSVEGIDIHELFLKYEELFEKFGGHAMACGFTITMENYEKLKTSVLKDFSANHDVIVGKYDIEADTSKITAKLVEQLELLEPFGKGNETPVFKVDNVMVSDIRLMGAEKKHVRFKADGLQCVYFNYDVDLKENQSISLLGFPMIDEWNGQKTIKFNVRGII